MIINANIIVEAFVAQELYLSGRRVKCRLKECGVPLGSVVSPLENTKRENENATSLRKAGSWHSELMMKYVVNEMPRVLREEKTRHR